MAELDFKAVTLGTVFDQYTHPVSYWQSGAFPSPKKTWAYIKKGMARWFNERQARTAVRSNIPGGFSTEAFHEEMADIYLRVQRAQAQMQPDLARDLVSRDVFIKMRAQTEQRRKQGWREITWEVLDEEQLSKNIKQVRARTLKLVEKSPFDWLQFTFCITSKQRFAAYGVDGDKRPCRLAGDESQVLDVTEYVVFERKTRARVRMAGGPLPTLGKAEHIEGSRWRLVAWLEP